tara:strand:+ start:5151 stop:8687 length:3537 start_codon:yes stop_codon:yes gene_type:complete
MSQSSNLYAEKVFSEHPVALWPFDDEVQYLSFLTIPQKRFDGWTVSGGVIESSSPLGLNIPIKSSQTVKASSTSSSQISMVSPNIISASSLDQDKETFCVSLYLLAESSSIESVDIGYQYTDSGEVEILENFSISATQVWSFLSKTFTIPNTTEDIRIVVQINMSTAGDYSAYVNGLSFGQWSENFATSTSGTTPLLLEAYENVALPSLKAFPASAYGLIGKNAYYLASDNSFVSYNAGFPIVYGSNNLTKIKQNGSNPSLIFPGFGFLNDAGRYKTLTLEFWLRAIPKSYTPFRIVGPISSTDGLYIDGEFITLKIGDNSSSHFIGNWGRPMLIDIIISDGEATLLINGDSVISLSFNSSTIELPLNINKSFGSLNYNKEQDWIGVYGSDNLSVFDMETVAIYSYTVSSIVAKRRFVYGQGVEFPESSNTAFGGSSVLIDYKVSEYANNYLYPDMARWNQGITENISTGNSTLSAPSYQLPATVLKSASQSEWLAACQVANDSSTDPKKFVDLSLASSDGGYFLFEDLGVLSETLKAFYAVFRSTVDTEQTLILVEDKVTKNSFRVSVLGTEIRYVLQYDGKETSVVSEAQHTVGLAFAAGVDIDSFSSSYGSNLATFFGSINRLRMYVGGNPGFVNTFVGKIYRVGFSTKRNLLKISSLFSENGTTKNDLNVFDIYGSGEEIYGGDYDTTVQDFLDGGTADSFQSFQLYDHVASYTMTPIEYLGSFSIDIATDSSWQDYIPLKYFGKNVNNINSQQEYHLDYLQINVDNPTIYSVVSNKFDNTGANVKTYVSFQYLASGANILSENLTAVELAPENKVIYPGDSWLTTKYEFVNGMVVYPPKGQDFSRLAIVLHVDMQIDGVLGRPVSVKGLQIASQALQRDSLTPIGTRFGNNIYPYILRGIYYDYDANNPVEIYKNSSPYMYLTDSSGISLVGDIGSSSRGIRIPVNSQQTPSFEVGAVQGLVKYNKDSFPSLPEKVFSINGRTETISVYVVADNATGTRGRLYFEDENGDSPGGLVSYINGKFVKDSYVNPQEWFMLGMQFAISLDFGSFTGDISSTGNMAVNVMSAYRLSTEQSAITTRFRSWSELEEILAGEGINSAVWGDLLDHIPPITWANVLYVPTVKTYLVDLEAIYKAYTGTNNFIVNDSSTLVFKNYAYRAYSGISWDNRVISPI